MYNVTLANKDCIFDSGTFQTLQEAISFARGRGGKYVVHIVKGTGLGVSCPYDSDTDTFSWYDGYEWHPVDIPAIEKLL